MIDYPGAINMLVDEQRVFIDNNTHEYLVIHKTAGFNTVAELGAYFATTDKMTSSHFGVGLNGSIAQYVLLKDGAAANCCGINASKYFTGNGNLESISIEHIDPTGDNSTTPPQAQLDASFKLAKWICNKYNIPSSKVIRHGDIDPIGRARCPGNYPMVLLRKYIDMPEGSTLNESIVEIWSDCKDVLGPLTPIPPRGTGIFNAWRNDLIKGKFRGIPLGSEKHGVDFNGNTIVRQQFSSSMAWWYEDTSLNNGNHILWNDIT